MRANQGIYQTIRIVPFGIGVVVGNAFNLIQDILF